MKNQNCAQLVILGIFVLNFCGQKYVEAQAFNCDGVWSSKPCSAGTPLATLSNPILTPKSDTEVKAISEKNRKETLVHDLRMKAIGAERVHKLHFEIEPIADFCSLGETSKLACSEKVNEMHDRIDKRINELELLANQKKANELQAEKNKIESEKNGGNNITIVRQPVYIVQPTPTPLGWRPLPNRQNSLDASVNPKANKEADQKIDWNLIGKKPGIK